LRETRISVCQTSNQFLSSCFVQNASSDASYSELQGAMNSDTASAPDIACYLVIDVCGGRVGLCPGEHRRFSGVALQIAEAIHVVPK
jgi:hypothetical protein